jgi:hypothetical protein
MDRHLLHRSRRRGLELLDVGLEPRPIGLAVDHQVEGVVLESIDGTLCQEGFVARVYAPSGALAAASRATPCAGTYADVPVEASVSLRELDGIGVREGVLLVRSPDGVSAVFCDTLLNLPWLTGVLGLFLHPTGTLSVPRATSLWFAKDRRALRANLERLADEDGVVRVIPGHGNVVASGAAGRLREAAARLGA